MSYKDMKLRSKFIFTLVLMTIMVTLLIGLAQFSFLKMSDMMVNDFVQIEYDNMKSQMSMRKDIQSINKRLLLAMYDTANNPVKEQREDFDSRFKDMRDRLSKLENTLEDKTLLANLSTAMDALEKDSYALLDMLDKGDTAGAIAFYQQGFNAVTSENFVSALSAVGKLSDEHSEAKIQEAKDMRVDSGGQGYAVKGKYAFGRGLCHRNSSLCLCLPEAAKRYYRKNRYGFQGNQKDAQRSFKYCF